MSAPAPGSPEWLRYMTASKIAAVVGTSPYESRFALWHRMHGDLPQQEQTAAMSLGHLLEPLLVQQAAQRHPDLEPSAGRWVVHPRIEWAAATPDGFLGEHALVEAKTARQAWEWREDPEAAASHRRVGVPAGYYDQCQWQMWVTGRTVTYVSALVDMALTERVVPVDRGRIERLIDAAEGFMASLAADQAPPLDGSTHTYQAVRDLHPDIDDADIEVPEIVATRWLTAKDDLDEATTAELAAKAALLQHMSGARRALVAGQIIARRQPARGGISLYRVAQALEPAKEPAA